MPDPAPRAVPSQPETPGDITSPVEIDSATPKDEVLSGVPETEATEIYELEATEVPRFPQPPDHGVRQEMQWRGDLIFVN